MELTANREIVEMVNNVNVLRDVKVVWQSTRSNEAQSGICEVTGVTYKRNGEFRITLLRDDGQRMYIEGDGKIYSVNSKHPLTGDVIEMKNV